jgi:dihydropteroate synthase
MRGSDRMNLRHRHLDDAARPWVMGILNVTPDSFSDGGSFDSAEAALAHALALADEGATIIDVGPESSRPGSEPVAAEEQIHRAVPVIASLREARPELVISIDTRLAAVAAAALDAGADIVNDISALRDDPALALLVAEREAAIVLMHMRGTPRDMQAGGGPAYDDVLGEVEAFLLERAEAARRAGIAPDRIILDPGIGFGKQVVHNLALLGSLDRFVALGYPVLVGASRKRFIGAILDQAAPKDRVIGSVACATLAARAGVQIIRAHDVRETVQAARLGSAVRRALAEGAPAAAPTD